MAGAAVANDKGEIDSIGLRMTSGQYSKKKKRKRLVAAELYYALITNKMKRTVTILLYGITIN